MIQKAIKNSSNSETIDCYRALIPKFCEIPASCRFASGIWKIMLCFWMLLVSTSRTNFLETTYPAQRTTMNTYPEYLYTDIYTYTDQESGLGIIIHQHSSSCQICCLPLPAPGHWKVPSGWQHWSQSLPDTEKNTPNSNQIFSSAKSLAVFSTCPTMVKQYVLYKIVIVIITIVIRQPC